MENKPTHFAYHVRSHGDSQDDERRDFWTRIGAAWTHRNGKGITVLLDALPLSGRLVLLERPADETTVEVQEVSEPQETETEPTLEL